MINIQFLPLYNQGSKYQSQCSTFSYPEEVRAPCTTWSPPHVCKFGWEVKMIWTNQNQQVLHGPLCPPVNFVASNLYVKFCASVNMPLLPLVVSYNSETCHYYIILNAIRYVLLVLVLFQLAFLCNQDIVSNPDLNIQRQALVCLLCT